MSRITPNETALLVASAAASQYHLNCHRLKSKDRCTSATAPAFRPHGRQYEGAAPGHKKSESRYRQPGQDLASTTCREARTAQVANGNTKNAGVLLRLSRSAVVETAEALHGG